MKQTYYLEFNSQITYSVLIDAVNISQAIDYAEDLIMINGPDVFYNEQDPLDFNFGKSVDPLDYDLPRFDTPKEYEVYND